MRSTSTGGCRSAGWRRSWALRSRRLPAATVGCATSTESGWSASSTVSDWVARTGPCGSAVRPMRRRRWPPRWPNAGHRLGPADLGRHRDLLHGQCTRRAATRTHFCWNSSRRAVGSSPSRLFASCTCSLPPPPSAPGAEGLTPEEVDRLAAPSRSPGLAADRPVALLSEDDWPLVRALEEDGRATHRELAAVPTGTSPRCVVGRRVVGSGMLYLDLDVDSELLGLRSRANLWRQWHRRH